MASPLVARISRVLVLPSLALAACLAPSACGGTTGAGPGPGTGGPGPGGTVPEGGCAAAPPCSLASAPATLHLTVSGFVKCGCFNGTFVLTQQQASPGAPPVWASPPITGCPGQSEPAYLKFSETASTSYDATTGEFVLVPELGIGITDQTSDPGSGNSDYAPASNVGSCTATAFSVSGGGSQAGNIGSFCAGVEDENMTWSLTQ